LQAQLTKAHAVTADTRVNQKTNRMSAKAPIIFLVKRVLFAYIALIELSPKDLASRKWRA
jgi:hypothetical protein